MKLKLDNVHLVSNESKYMIHNLESQPYYLLFARGNADPFTLEKDIHSVNDNPQFPWMTQEMATLEKDIHSVNDNPQFPWMTQEMASPRRHY
ncbi:unnamed protein product [Strongylus vulgaris]|uniref:Uncharacterized protein n=1 Tax=Strongylus vulgaris TaxID=40348 RepID=A0A3P7J6U9_STRVU|nr:unnamed protein product [Strongylus vulgaris]